MDMSIDDIVSQLEARGISVSREEIERLAPVFELYFNDLKTLRSLDLGAEEPATVFDLAREI